MEIEQVEGPSESQDEECLASISAALDLMESRGTPGRFVIYGACWPPTRIDRTYLVTL